MPSSPAFAAIFVIALLIDLFYGDPSSPWHPVGWMGYGIGWLRPRKVGALGAPTAFAWGLLAVCLGLMLTCGVASVLQWLLMRTLREDHPVLILLALGLGGMALKGSFAFRSLVSAGLAVKDALAAGDENQARRLLSLHLVSRPVEDLSSGLLTSACIESLTENFTDSVAAPLFFYGIAGFPGAWGYRFVDTADSMLGYRDEEREWLGKTAARLDDLFCFVPSRLAGLSLVLASVPAGLDARRAWTTMIREARASSSPNSGWTMAAAAGALGVRLEKISTYVINRDGRIPGTGDIVRVKRLIGWALLLWVPFILASAWYLLPAVHNKVFG